MDPHAGGLRRDVELTADVLVGLVGQDPQLDRSALAIRQVRKCGGEVVVKAVEPGWIDARLCVRREL